MPFIDVTLVEGRDPAVLRELIHTLTHAAAAALDANPESIRVVLREVPPTHWAAGDMTLDERRKK